MIFPPQEAFYRKIKSRATNLVWVGVFFNKIFPRREKIGAIRRIFGGKWGRNSLIVKGEVVSGRIVPCYKTQE